MVALSPWTCTPDIQINSFGSRALRYSSSIASRGSRSSPVASTMMKGRGEIAGTQRTGSSRGPAMMTFAIAAAGMRSGAKGIVVRMLASSGT